MYVLCFVYLKVCSLFLSLNFFCLRGSPQYLIVHPAKLSALYAYVPTHCVFQLSLFFSEGDKTSVHSVCYLSDASETPSLTPRT